MLDLKFVRENIDAVKESLRKRNTVVDLEEFMDLDGERRKILTEAEALKSKRNTASKEIGRIKKEGGDASALVAEMTEAGEKIKDFDARTREIDEKMKTIALAIPNIPHPSIPEGPDETYAEEIKKWGEIPAFGFEPKAHWDLGEKNGFFDFERAAKVSGARFTFYKGAGARLERALISFMLDVHTLAHGYTELLPPYIVNSASMTGTGQLPKFAEDMFKLENTDYYLIPTAEVPVTNYFRDEILEEESLPFYFCAYSGCFRAEAGSAGRDTRGLIRQHQFNKVELVKFAHPENSYEELEKLTANAEKILQLLELPYRVITLPTGDIGFSSAKTYDIEVWLPSFNVYREISSCSNFEDFQARRANIRYKGKKGKPQFVHTLNGSGLAIGRTTAAVIENFQQEDGSIRVPEVLRKYMGGIETIK